MPTYSMAARDKMQCPIRLHKDQYEKIRFKCAEDRITFQKLAEVCFRAYLKDNKEIRRLIKVWADSKYARKKRPILSDMESDELLRLIEEEHTPLRDLVAAAADELDTENENL